MTHLLARAPFLALCALVVACQGAIIDPSDEPSSAPGGTSEAELRASALQSTPAPDSLTVTFSSQSALSMPGVGGMPMAGSFSTTLAQPRVTASGVHLQTQAQLAIAHQLIQRGAARVYQGGSLHGTFVFGPMDLEGVTYRLVVQRSQDASSFALSAKPAGAADSAFVKVLTGELSRKPDLVVGKVGLDLDALKSVKASEPGQGLAYAAFARSSAEHAVCLRLDHFSADSNLVPAVDADLGCQHQLPSRETRAKLAYRQDVLGNGSPSDVHSRLHFLPAVGGRVDMTVSGGLLPAGGTVQMASCWDVQDREVYHHVQQCLAGTCTTLASFGSTSACRPEVALEDPALPTELACSGLASSVPGQSAPNSAPTTMPEGPILN